MFVYGSDSRGVHRGAWSERGGRERVNEYSEATRWKSTETKKKKKETMVRSDD